MDTFDYQRSSVPARMPAQRGGSLSPQRFDGSASETTPSALSVKAVLRASRRYWWLILALWTVGSAGIAVGVYIRVKPQFRASSWLRVEPTEIDLYGGLSRPGTEPYMQTHVTLITSPNVLESAANLPTVFSWPRIKESRNAIQELRKSIQVSIQPGTHIIEVAMISPIAAEAAAMVNGVVQEFLALNRTWSNVTTNKQIAKLREYQKTLETSIKLMEADLRVRIKKIGESGHVIPLNGEGMAIAENEADDDKKAKKAENDRFNWTVENYKTMLAKLSATKLELFTAESNLEALRQLAQESAREIALGNGSKSRTTDLIDQKIKLDPEMNQLRQKYLAAKDHAEKIGIATRHSGDPAERVARQTAGRILQDYQAAFQRKRIDYQNDPTMGSGDPRMELAKAERIVQELVRTRFSLEQELSKIKLETGDQQSEEFEYQLLSRDHAHLKDLHKKIFEKLEELTFASNSSEERIRLINEAKPEGIPIPDKRLQYMAMAPIGILGAVLGLVVLLELRSGRVADTEILSSRMKHEVFAIAPLPNHRPGLGFDNDKAEQRLARFVQSLDHLRVALCEGGMNGEGRVVMITSATGGEGKTTLSAHLAARCANAGTSTLLIDADLRRASLGRLLDVPQGPGLGDVLAGDADLDENLISVQAGGFHFLSAGTPGIDPTRVLKSTRLAELIGQLRQMYDLVIIDTPPVLPVADALIMGRWADGAVMAARYDASRLPLVERANRQIIAAGIPVLGVVVNGVKGHDQSYGNYAYNYNYPGRQDPLNDGDIAS